MGYSSNIMVNADLRFDLMEVVDERKIPKAAQIYEAADKIAPPVKVNRKDGHLPVLKAGDGDRLISGDRGEDGSFPRFGWEASDQSFYTRPFGWEMPIDDLEDYEANEIINVEQYHAEQLSDTRAVRKEFKVSNLVNNKTLYPAANQTTITLTADNMLQGTNLLDMGDTAAEALFGKTKIEKEQLSMIIGIQALRNIVQTLGDFKDNSIYTAQNIVQYRTISAKIELLRDYLGVKEIIPVSGAYNTAHFKQTASFARLWSQTQITYAILSPGGMWDASFMRQPQFTKPLGGREFIIETYDEKATMQSITRLVGYDGQYMNANYGYIVDDIFAIGV